MAEDPRIDLRATGERSTGAAGMTDLLAFLRARIADSRARTLELRARTAEDRGEVEPWKPEGHDPVMVDLDAKRRIIELHSSPHTVVDGFCVEEGGPCTHVGENFCQIEGTDDCSTLRLLALPYADHPDYCEEWHPDHGQEG